MHDDSFKKAVQLRKKTQEDRSKEENTKLKKQIKETIRKDFLTVGIGIIALIEEYFGYLWKHNQDVQLTAQESQWLEVWLDLRQEILDHVNNKIRKNLQIIESVDVTKKVYVLEIVPETELPEVVRKTQATLNKMRKKTDD